MQQTVQQRALMQHVHATPPPPPGGRWKHSPCCLMREACLQESPALTATPPAMQGPQALRLRLHFGKALPLCKERDCERQYRQLYTAVFQQGQQQEEADSSDLLQYAAAHHTCSSVEARGRSGFVDVLLHKADAAVSAAMQCVRSGGLQVGPRRVPVSWAAAAQPADAVRIVFMNPPLQFARQGFTRTVLAAAGYDDLDVVHEQLGFSRLVGDAAMRVPCADSIVAYVRAADGDLILRQLPDAFECGDGRHVPTTIFVEGRTAQQPQLWQHEQQRRLRTKQRGRALQQERVLHTQQQEEHTSRTQQQLRAAWTRRQQQLPPASQQQQQQQQETVDAEMEDVLAQAPATAAQQQVQQAQAAAARVAETFPGTLQQAGAAATLPCDPFAQQQGDAALQHAAAAATAAATAPAAYEEWRGDWLAEHICLRAEDLAGADFSSADQETMLRAFFAQHGAAEGSTAVVEQWLREYFPEAAAASYGEDDEQEGAADAAGEPGGTVADARGRDQQQEGADAVIGAADAAAGAAAPLQAQRRSGRRRREPDPVFAADVNTFAALASQQQHGKSHDTAAAAAQPDTPPQRSRPRRGRAS